MIREFYERHEKAIPYSMELTDLGGPLIGSGAGFYGAYNPYVPGAVPYGRVQTPMSQRESAVHSQVYGGTEPVDWLMDAVGYIIQTASDSCFHFEDDQNKEFVLKKDADDPPETQEVPFGLKLLFDKPNPYMDWQEFLEVTLIDFLLLGNAYWAKFKINGDGQPASLYRMVPSYVQIIPDEYGPAKYLYKLPQQQQPIEFDPTEILHFRRANPNNPYFGVGLVKGGARAVDMELAFTNTMARYYEQNAIPGGVVETERRVPRDVFNRLKSQLQSFYGGSQNAGKLMVLEAGLKFTGITPSAADALFGTIGAWSRDRILAMFNMNKVLIGIAPDSGDPSIADWQRLFDQKTMIPLLNKFGKAVSRGLTQPGWGLDLKFDYEETQAPADVINRATMFAKLPGVKVKELRKAAGLTPSTGDDKIDNMVLNLPGPNLDENGQGGFADRNLPGEAGRPPLPENTRAITSSGPAGHPGTATVASNSKAMETVQDILDRISMRKYVLEGKALPPARTHVGEISNAVPPQDTLHADRTTQVDAIVASMTRDLSEAAHALERGLLDATEGKAEGTTYQRIKNSKAWAAFRARVSDILQSGAEQGVSLANIQHTKTGHQPNMDMDYAALAKAQVQRPEGGALSIVKTFKDRVLKEVLALQRSGANPGEYTKTLMAAIADWRDKHAETIALTEASIAYNEGTFGVAEANGKDHVLVSDGNDTDEPCMEANGSIWTLDYAREHSLEHPRCRRAFVPADAPAA